MYLVKLSDTFGINLEHVIAWKDELDRPTPRLVVWVTVPGEYTAARQVPYTLHLEGDERLLLLQCFAANARTEDWKGAYEELREEHRTLTARLNYYRDYVSEHGSAEDRERLREAMHAHEAAVHERTIATGQ
jgi:hypothetical protein